MAATAILLIVGAGASFLIYAITPWGPGVSPDSIVYMQTAHSLLSGYGCLVGNKPLVHHPPMYPLLLAAAGFFTRSDLIQASRLLGAIFTGINLVILGLAVRLCTENRFSAIASIVVFFLASATVFTSHTMAWSEPPFIAFTLTALILLSLYLVNSSLYVLIGASLFIGLAMITRYVGIALLSTAAIALLVLEERPWRKRIKDVFLAVVISSFPLVVFLIRNVLVANSLTDRSIVFHPIESDKWKSLFVSILHFTLPISIPFSIKIIYLAVVSSIIVLFFIVFLYYRKMIFKENNIFIVIPITCIIFFITYISFLIISISFFDANIYLDNRILLPGLLPLVIAFISISLILSRYFKANFIWYFFLSLFWVTIFFNGATTIKSAVSSYYNGRWLNSKFWHSSETVKYLKSKPISKIIYSNGQDIIWFFTKNYAQKIPVKINPHTRIINQHCATHLSQISQEIATGEAIIVYFYHVPWKWFLPSLHEIESEISVPVHHKFADGVILGNP